MYKHIILYTHMNTHTRILIISMKLLIFDIELVIFLQKLTCGQSGPFVVELAGKRVVKLMGGHFVVELVGEREVKFVVGWMKENWV